MTKIIRKYLSSFEKLNISKIDDLLDCVDEKIFFSDPFHTISGKKKFRNVLLQMFDVIKKPKFKIINLSNNKNLYYVKWSFSGFYKKEFSFVGISEIEIKNSLITKHIDFWDSGRNFYSKLPLVGSIFRKFHK